MTTRVMKAALAALVAAFVLAATTDSADAFWGHRRGVTTAYALPSVPVVAAYAPAPVVVARPVVVASPIVTANYAPVVTANYAPVAAPVTTYYAPAAPVTTYYAPAPIVTAAPTTTFYAPAPAFVAPTTTFYAPAAPVIVRRPLFWP